jgi:glucosamine--fructose-6-phosphate aminotransferase (isomerizing)
MRAEALQAPDVVARALAADGPAWAALGAELAAQPPTSLLTVARGSSDHAAHYLAYLVTARLGRLVTSLPMSLVTLYGSQLRCEGLLAIALSQSGQSPDLVLPLQHIAARGGRTLAFVNDAASPLAAAAQRVFALHAGVEASVAATKSYIAQLVCGARLVSVWQRAEHADDDGFGAALQALPEALAQAAAADWGAGVAALVGAERLYVIGRGTGLPVAMEAALKFKEVCGIQAEAYSGAEVQHGPMALVEQGFPMLVLAPRGPAQAGLLLLATQMRERGAQVLLAAPAGTPGASLPIVASGHAELDPITTIQSFYPLVEALARARGLDPDRPRHLQKVTRTR